MKNWKRFLALFLSGAMALSLCACGGELGGAESASPDPSAGESGGPEASEPPEIVADLNQSALEFSAGVSPSDVLLTVNGSDVSADLFLYLLGQVCGQTQQYFSYFGMNLSDMPDAAGDLLEQGVELTAYHVLMRQKAAELGCLLTDSQNSEISAAMDEADLESSTPYWDLSSDSIKFIFEMSSYYENVLEAATHLPDGQELQEYLDAEGVFRVKHILLKTVDDDQQPLSEDVIAEKRTQAEDLLAQLQAADDMPARFDELMNANSEDGGLQSNPDGYVFTGESSLVGGFREAALALNEGELSGIVETDYGYHIMLRLPLTDETKTQYQDSFRTDALEGQVDQWIEAAEITRSDVLSSLNAIDFYTRLAAYQQALSEQNTPEESGAEG